MTTQDGQRLTAILRATTAPASWTRSSLDRTKTIRTVPMKVLSLGYPRTGTMSTAAALSILGFNDVYHMISVFENPGDCEIWMRAIEGKRGGGRGKFTKRDWDALLGHCMAVTDWPASAFPDELIAAYPEAKVILHVRPTDKWFASVKSTILGLGDSSSVPLLWRPFAMLSGYLVTTYGPLISKTRPMSLAIRSMVTNGDPTPSNFLHAYEAHNAHIKSIVPPANLLLWGPQDGWEPLCAFLGVPVPEVPLPYINETESFREMLGALAGRDLREVVGWGVRGVVGVAVAVGGVVMVGRRVERRFGVGFGLGARVAGVVRRWMPAL